MTATALNSSNNIVPPFMPAGQTPKKKSLFTSSNLVPLASGIGIGLFAKMLVTSALTPLGLGAVAGAAFSFGSIMKNNWKAGQGLKNFSLTNLKSIFSNKSNRRKMYMAAAFGAVGAGGVEVAGELVSSAQAAECVESSSGGSVKIGDSCLQTSTDVEEPAIPGKWGFLDEDHPYIQSIEGIEHHEGDGHNHQLSDKRLLPPAEIVPEQEDLGTVVIQEPVRVGDGSTLKDSFGGEVVTEREVPLVPSFEEYTLTNEDADGLKRIAMEHYGLTDDKEIRDAISAIAHTSCMDEGDVNWVKEGQTIRLPMLDGSAPSLNWSEVAQEFKAGPDYWDGDLGECPTADPVPQLTPEIEPSNKFAEFKESVRVFFEEPVVFEDTTIDEEANDLGTTIIQEPVRVGDGSTLKDGFGEDVVTEREVPLVPPFEEYTLTGEDSAGLGRIVAEHYGLTEESDVLNALNHIAHANCMDENDINWVKEGQTIRLPTLDGSAPSLDWYEVVQELKDGPDGYWDGNLNNCAAPAPVPAPQ